MRYLPAILFPFLLIAAPAGAAGLPDTGVDTCYNDTVADTVLPTSLDSIDRDNGTHPRQDCRYGLDAAAVAGMQTKLGGGPKGFDYTKIANNGTTLGPGAALGTSSTSWACTLDNITGLLWEVKTIAFNTDLRYVNHNYTWYNVDATQNGGQPGLLNTSSSCNATLANCNTAAYITAVNALSAGAGLCNHNDWRLPTQRELSTLIMADGTNPSVAPAYFPNTSNFSYYSSATYALNPGGVWTVQFGVGGFPTVGDKSSVGRVRVVRGPAF